MFTRCTYVRNNSPLACRLVCIKMEIIVSMPNVPVPPPPSLFIPFIQITASNKRGKKSLIRFLLKTSKLNPVLCLGTPRAGLGEEGDRGGLRCHTGGDREAATAPGRGCGGSGLLREPVQWMSRRWSSASVASAAGAPNEPVCLNSE